MHTTTSSSESFVATSSLPEFVFTCPSDFIKTFIICFAVLLLSLQLHTIDPFQKWRHVTWFREVQDKHQTNRMCPRTKLRVILKFSLNSELLCGTWLLKSFQEREGQRILSYSRNSVDEIKAQKASLIWASNFERLGSPVLKGKILQLTLLHLTEFAVTILHQVCNLA